MTKPTHNPELITTAEALPPTDPFHVKPQPSLEEIQETLDIVETKQEQLLQRQDEILDAVNDVVNKLEDLEFNMQYPGLERD